MTIHFATWALGVEFGVSRVEPLDWASLLQRHCVMMTIGTTFGMIFGRTGIRYCIMLNDS